MTLPRPRPFLIVLLLGALNAISPFAIDMYLAAFTQIAMALHTSVATVSLSLSSYFVGLAVGQVIYGPLLDRFGRKRPVYFGLLLFIASSIGCACAHTVSALIVLRLLQALGGCVAQVAAVTMVRDFFPASESGRILSLMMLVLGVSPLLAPTVGSFISLWLGWQWVFILLGLIVALILSAVFFFLPEGHVPDASVSLKPLPILKTFISILGNPQFRTYTLAGAFSFAGLFAYVGGSPVIFMHQYHVGTRAYGIIFAALAVGFIGGSQVNVWLSYRHKSSRIFQMALIVQCSVGTIFLLGLIFGWYGLAGTLILLFLLLSCVGLTYPNAAAVALEPFTRNAGSASALLGFLQMGIGSIASSCVGLLDAQTALPIIAILVGSAFIGALIFAFGKRAASEPAKLDEAYETLLKEL